MNLLPKDEKFFELFERHAHILCRASHLLNTGLKGGYEGMRAVASDVSALEDEGDHVIHDIFGRLRSTFITPFDPEDIQSLATALDNVLDDIDDVVFRIVAYRLDPMPAVVPQLGEKVDHACAALAKALTALHKKRSVVEHCIEVNRLENEADALQRGFLVKLFAEENDPVALIKNKEIVELLEAATDRCEDVADAIQNVSVKNA
jgi:predicted phosphate transport protein (TIGR00153 family)